MTASLRKAMDKIMAMIRTELGDNNLLSVFVPDGLLESTDMIDVKI